MEPHIKEKNIRHLHYSKPSQNEKGGDKISPVVILLPALFLAGQ